MIGGSVGIDECYFNFGISVGWLCVGYVYVWMIEILGYFGIRWYGGKVSRGEVIGWVVFIVIVVVLVNFIYGVVYWFDVVYFWYLMKFFDDFLVENVYIKWG